ncbi:MAG: DUF87 domain-containing protein [Candidatus Absconditabacterales bacterium]|nr:DUF87 domain-containing protein [Candidatus Absconditabacterales bacterium]
MKFDYYESLSQSFASMGSHVATHLMTLPSMLAKKPFSQPSSSPLYGQRFVTLHISPYKYGSYTIPMWHNVLKNLSDLPLFHCGIKGNSNHLALIVRVDRDDMSLVQTIIFTMYPDVTITQQDYGDHDYEYFYFIPSADAQWMSLDSVIASSHDPFQGILSLFLSIPDNQERYFGIDAKPLKKQSFWSFLSPLIKQYDHEWYSCLIKFGSNQMYKGIDDVMVQICRTMLQNYLHSGTITLSISPKHIRINRETLALLFHIPHDLPGGLSTTTTRYFPIPSSLKNPSDDAVLSLGTMCFRGTTTSLMLSMEDMCRHMYVIGKSGMGKTTFAKQVLASWLKTGMGCCVLDPHGDLYEYLLHTIPKHRINDVVVIDINDADNPIGYNMLGYETQEERDLLVSGLIGVFHKLFSYSRGPRLEYILRNSILTAMEIPQATIYDVTKLLTNTQFRNSVIERISDPLIKDFWLKEFNQRSERQKQESIGPVLNKLGQFLSHPRVRLVFGNIHKTVSFRSIVNEGKICLINLSKGKLGEDVSTIIGSFFITQLQIDVMTIPLRSEKKFLVVIDEFQNFATDSFATFLSESRKFGVGLVLLHQYLDQMPEATRAAIFGNVGSLISFGIGSQDAMTISQEFNETISPKDLVALPQFTCYVKIMHASQRFFPLTLLIPPKQYTMNDELKASIIAQSRARYSISQATAEHILQRVEEMQPLVIAKPAPTEFVDELQLGETYVGTVKMFFNYGIFVSFGKWEGLLHKKDIIDGESGMWRKIYKPGDPITVIAKGFKVINNEKKVVRSQLV